MINKYSKEEHIVLNIPNKLTIIRVCLSPVFLIFLLWSSLPHHYLYANLIFIIASITDAIDGKFARKHNLITDFGKFLDPLADKILVACALVGMVELHILSSWYCVIILAREFMVTSIRLVAAGKGNVIAANFWGKLKTVTQLIAIIAILTFEEGLFILNEYFSALAAPYMNIINTSVLWLNNILMAIATLATVISGIKYVSENIQYIKSGK